ncbi:hypothetical protein MES5069_160023 [Mesorhizobium escarrei]|uniref:Uncharacterized protein n=1 Tax=Mesorhizobium escarrei TaxID=666018 RepID=A0ABN8JHM2_9HYPH|nr:hypothetical protein MES5069_160023 [Mesorhizobium escarrei]
MDDDRRASRVELGDWTSGMAARGFKTPEHGSQVATLPLPAIVITAVTSECLSAQPWRDVHEAEVRAVNPRGCG